MSPARPLVVLRPEPGNAATAARAEALGLPVIRLPLFRVVPRVWEASDPAGFDALLLTSANAVRHAGPELARYAGLPLCAVGVATADAAREAGLRVWLTGTGGVGALLADAALAGVTRALHLAGEDRTPVEGAAARIVAASATVYASEAVPIGTAAMFALAGSVALLHSTRAAGRLAELADHAGLPCDGLRITAISEPVAAAAGAEWDRVAVAAAPTDDALLAAARDLAEAP